MSEKEYTFTDLLNDEMNELIENLPQVKALKAEIEELKQTISGYVSDQEVWVSGYQGAQKENESLKLQVTALTNTLNQKEEECRLCKDANETIKANAAELKKQLEELKREKALFDLQLNFQIGEADIANRRAEQLQKEVESLRKNRLVFVKPKDLNPDEMKVIEQLSRQFIIPIQNDETSVTPVTLFAELEKDIQKKLLEDLREFFIEQTAYGCDTNHHCGYYDYTVKMGEVIEALSDFAKERYSLEV